MALEFLNYLQPWECITETLHKFSAKTPVSYLKNVLILNTSNYDKMFLQMSTASIATNKLDCIHVLDYKRWVQQA